MLTKFELGYLALVRGFHAWLFRSAPALAKAKIQQLVHQQFQKILSRRSHRNALGFFLTSAAALFRRRSELCQAVVQLV